MEPNNLNNLFGNIDLFLLDQILKNRFSKTGRILDAGCGEGRNVHYFLKNNYPVYGVDCNDDALRMCKMVVQSINPAYVENFLNAHIEELPFPNGFFNSVICCSVLHYAKDQEHFMSMIKELNRVICNGGLLFVRMIDKPEEGIPFSIENSWRDPWEEMGYVLLEPKRSIVQNNRSLNVMVFQKGE